MILVIIAGERSLLKYKQASANHERIVARLDIITKYPRYALASDEQARSSTWRTRAPRVYQLPSKYNTLTAQRSPVFRPYLQTYSPERAAELFNTELMTKTLQYVGHCSDGHYHSAAQQAVASKCVPRPAVEHARYTLE